MRRDAEVLSLFAAIISKLREAMGAEVPRIFEAVFECTLQMITKNFEVRCIVMKCAQCTRLRPTAAHGWLLIPSAFTFMQGCCIRLKCPSRRHNMMHACSHSSKDT